MAVFLLTLRQAAKRMEMNLETMRQLVWAGKIPFLQDDDGIMLFDAGVLDHLDKPSLSKTQVNSKRLLNMKQAADYIGMGVWKMRRMVWNKELPFLQHQKGSPLLFDIADLNKWIEANKKKHQG